MDYRGELCVIIYNASQSYITITPGERIAQMVFAKCEHADLEVVDKLPSTKRGEGGFGHTGKE